MKRNKEWWNRLSKEERSELVYLERNSGSYGCCSYLPDDCSECRSCGNPAFGGYCNHCEGRIDKLIEKANNLQKA